MNKVKRYREMYQRELITETQIDKLIEKGILTESDKIKIINEEN